jgi:hypothetical protein
MGLVIERDDRRRARRGGTIRRRGLRLLRYSEAVRFDRLGICATSGPWIT